MPVAAASPVARSYWHFQDKTEWSRFAGGSVFCLCSHSAEAKHGTPIERRPSGASARPSGAEFSRRRQRIRKCAGFQRDSVPQMWNTPQDLGNLRQWMQDFRLAYNHNIELSLPAMLSTRGSARRALILISGQPNAWHAFITGVLDQWLLVPEGLTWRPRRKL